MYGIGHGSGEVRGVCLLHQVVAHQGDMRLDDLFAFALLQLGLLLQFLQLRWISEIQHVLLEGLLLLSPVFVALSNRLLVLNVDVLFNELGYLFLLLPELLFFDHRHEPLQVLLLDSVKHVSAFFFFAFEFFRSSLLLLHVFDIPSVYVLGAEATDVLNQFVAAVVG